MKKPKIPIPCDGCLCLSMCTYKTDLAPIAKKCNLLRNYLFTSGFSRVNREFGSRVLRKSHFYEALNFLKVQYNEEDVLERRA